MHQRECYSCLYSRDVCQRQATLLAIRCAADGYYAAR